VRNWSARAAVGLLVIFGLLALAAPALAPYDPRLPSGAPFSLPEPAHLFGTNDLGQDLFSNWLWDARASLVVAALVALVSTTLAWAVGLTTGTSARSGAPLLGTADLLLALPALLLYLLVLTLVGPSQLALIVVLGLTAWPTFARVVRARVLDMRGAPYVEAARGFGATPTRIALVHLFPGTRPLLPAQLALAARFALFAEATLAFLGLGDPSAAGWGGTLASAFADPLLFERAVWPWWVLPPALSIILVVLATTWLATALAGD
jgi:ABC-type dipeptide/oligopeptide/nickel transport system permease subunit